MPDREKVIEALHCRAYDDDLPCSICAYYRPDEKPVAKCDYQGLMEDAINLLKEQEARNECLKRKCVICPHCDNCDVDENGLLKEQEAKWIHREDLDFKDKLGCTHFHGMCENCGFIHDFIDDHTGQYKYCPQCGRAVKWE